MQKFVYYKVKTALLSPTSWGCTMLKGWNMPQFLANPKFFGCERAHHYRVIMHTMGTGLPTGTLAFAKYPVNKWVVLALQVESCCRFDWGCLCWRELPEFFVLRLSQENAGNVWKNVLLSIRALAMRTLSFRRLRAFRGSTFTWNAHAEEVCNPVEMLVLWEWVMDPCVFGMHSIIIEDFQRICKKLSQLTTCPWSSASLWDLCIPSWSWVDLNPANWL